MVLDDDELNSIFEKCVSEVADTITNEHIDEMPINVTIVFVTKEETTSVARLIMPQLPGDEEEMESVFRAVGNSFFKMTGDSVPIFLCMTREAWIKKAMNIYGDTLDYKEGVVVTGQSYDYRTRKAVVLINRKDDGSMAIGKTVRYGDNRYGSGYTDDPNMKYTNYEDSSVLVAFFQGVSDALRGIDHYENIDVDKIKGHVMNKEVGSLSEALKFTKEEMGKLEEDDKDKPVFGKN